MRSKSFISALFLAWPLINTAWGAPRTAPTPTIVWSGIDSVPHIDSITRTDTLPTVHISILRTPFDLKAAPFAVDVVPPQTGSVARPGMSLDEVLDQIPGVQADNQLNFALGDRIAIRGLGARAQFGVRGVRFIVDGIPATLADGQTTLNNLDLASFGSAQVLRGPASALYGNASGGVVIVESPQPPATLFTPQIELLGGTDGLRRANLGGGGSVGNFSYLLTGDQLNYDGYRAFSRARNGHLNSVMTYSTEHTQIKFVVNAEHHNAENPGGLSDSLINIDRRQAYSNNLAQHTGEIGSQLQIGTSAQIQLPVGELRTSLYWLHRSLDNPIPTDIVDLHRQAGGFRIAYGTTTGTTGHSITTMIGTESDLQRDDRQNYDNVHGVPQGLTLNQYERVSSLSPFVQVTAELGHANLFSGVRYDYFRFSVADRLITADNPDDSGIRDMSAVSPSAGISYSVTHTFQLYANIATAFQTPTTTELANRPDGAGGFNPSLQPEYAHSLEAGFHGTVGSRLAYHADAYRMRITGELLPFEVPSYPGRDFYRNTAVAQHSGIEAEGRLTLTSLLALHLSYTSLIARIITDTVDNGNDVGKRVPGLAPEYMTAALDVGVPEGRFASLELRAEGSTPVNDANTAYSDGYRVLNARFSTPLANGIFILGGIGNLFNARYNTSVIIDAVGGRYFEPAPGRTVYLGLRWGPYL